MCNVSGARCNRISFPMLDPGFSKFVRFLTFVFLLSQGVSHCWSKNKIYVPHNSFFFLIIYVFISAGSLLLHRLFSSCGELELLSSCHAWASLFDSFTC